MARDNCKWCSRTFERGGYWDDFCSEKCEHEYKNANPYIPPNKTAKQFRSAHNEVVRIAWGLALAFLFAPLCAGGFLEPIHPGTLHPVNLMQIIIPGLSWIFYLILALQSATNFFGAILILFATTVVIFVMGFCIPFIWEDES